jgi:hypothetical protein
MTGNLDRWGDPLEDIEGDDVAPVIPIRSRLTARQHIAELRRILAESRARREAKP